MDISDQHSPEVIELFHSLWQTSQHSLVEFCTLYGLDEQMFATSPSKSSAQAIRLLPLA